MLPEPRHEIPVDPKVKPDSRGRPSHHRRPAAARQGSGLGEPPGRAIDAEAVTRHSRMLTRNRSYSAPQNVLRRHMGLNRSRLVGNTCVHLHNTYVKFHLAETGKCAFFLALTLDSGP